MTDGAGRRTHAAQFDDVASAYEKHRPAYPVELVAACCDVADVRAGDEVLEIGCGPGQLTAALVDRGLRVVAVEPGARMIERARVKTGDAVRFVNSRFEDVTVDRERFSAVFSATAFHWVDPDVSWEKAASILRPGGALVLLTHCFGADGDSIEIERTLFDSVAKIAPDIAAGVPRPREADDVLDGARQRRGNVSELWSWITQFDVAVPQAADLFAGVRILHEIVDFAWTAERLNAHRRTTSLAFRLGPDRLAAIEHDTHRIMAGFGGQIQLPTLVMSAIARSKERV